MGRGFIWCKRDEKIFLEVSAVSCTICISFGFLSVFNRRLAGPRASRGVQLRTYTYNATLRLRLLSMVRWCTRPAVFLMHLGYFVTLGQVKPFSPLRRCKCPPAFGSAGPTFAGNCSRPTGPSWLSTATTGCQPSSPALRSRRLAASRTAARWDRCPPLLWPENEPKRMSEKVKGFESDFFVAVKKSAL